MTIGSGIRVCVMCLLVNLMALLNTIIMTLQSQFLAESDCTPNVYRTLQIFVAWCSISTQLLISIGITDDPEMQTPVR
jgi:hypothetical protein